MSIRQGNNWIAGSGSGATDNTSISKNTSNQLQAIGTKNKNAATGALDTKYDWVGTLAEFNQQNIAYDHPEWICYVTDDVSGGYSVYTKNESDARYLNNNQITNCITEIPQDIKLELNNGTLTLKAGSKVYVPNGIGVFEEKTLPSDLVKVTSGSDTDTPLLYVRSDLSSLELHGIHKVVSGDSDSQSGTTYHVWYDTANNIIKKYGSSSSTIAYTGSLPIALAIRNNGVVTSIDQVFNGFGYIGSTVFALPGVKGLIPNGRNADGSLNNIEIEQTEVWIRTVTNSLSQHDLALATSGIGINTYTYNEMNNSLYNSTGEKLNDRIIVGKIYNGSSSPYKISSLYIKSPFHVFDWNDLKSLPNYNPSTTQTLKHVNGVLQWG